MTSTRTAAPEQAVPPATPGRRTGRLASLYRLVASVALGSLVLAVVGAVTGPHWDPGPLDEGIEVATADTSIGDAPPIGSYDVRVVELTVQLDGTTVGARLSVPVGLTEPAPGVLFVHGAGTGRSSQAFRAQAQALAEAGVVALVPDKRLDTYSTRHRDYVEMAADYARSLAVLRDRPEVDPERVVVYAESEGAWIAPVMAAQDPDLAGVVLVSAPVVPPRQQAAFAIDSYLRNTGVPQAVFRAIPRAVNLTMPGGGFEYVDFDVTPWQRRMTQPVLVVYGTADASMPTVQGALQVRADVAAAGNRDVTVRYYEGADHGIRVGGSPTPEFLRDLAGWVLGLPGTGDALPHVAGAEPSQTFRAGPVPQPRWLRDGTALLVSVIGAISAMVLAGVAIGGARLAGRLRGGARPVHRYAPGVGVRLAALGATTVATTGGLVCYLLAVARLAMDYQRNALVVQGGWVAVRVLGIGAVLAVVLLARRVAGARADGVPVAPGALRRVVAVVVLFGSAVLLVVLAYWGVYQLNI